MGLAGGGGVCAWRLAQGALAVPCAANSAPLGPPTPPAAALVTSLQFPTLPYVPLPTTSAIQHYKSAEWGTPGKVVGNAVESVIAMLPG